MSDSDDRRLRLLSPRTTASINLSRIAREQGRSPSAQDRDISNRLREELRDKGIPGFRKGGRVKRTGIYRLHKGERVIKARARRARRR